MTIDENTLLIPNVDRKKHGVQPQPYVTPNNGGSSRGEDIEEVASAQTVALAPIVRATKSLFVIQHRDVGEVV